jgi:DNA-binding XRE family transcriptional regulator
VHPQRLRYFAEYAWHATKRPVDASIPEARLCTRTVRFIRSPLMPKGSSANDLRRPVLLQLLVETRTKAKLTQAELAEAAGVSQPYVSQVESGLIRLDGLQLVDWLHACDSTLGRFGTTLEKRLEESE